MQHTTPRILLPTVRLYTFEQDSSSVRNQLSSLLNSDSRVERNFGSFTNHEIGGDAEALMIQNYGKNLANSHEYAALSELHKRCVGIISQLWNAPNPEDTVGYATTGSSEAILLAGLAMKKLWAKKGLSCRPNLIVGRHAHLAIDKFSSICDVDLQKISISRDSNFSLDTVQLEGAVNQGTIGVILILGNTYTGHFDAIKDVNAILDKVEMERGLYVPIHVDAASGGFVAPFTNLPEKQWDFSISRVVSINASGHKYGLTSPALGWIIWRHQEHVAPEMYHVSSYLSGSSDSVTASFSQSGIHVIEQYFALSTLGTQGFKRLVGLAFTQAANLANSLEETGWFTCVNRYARSAGNFSNVKDGGIPIVVFAFSDTFLSRYEGFTEAWLGRQLRKVDISVPEYDLPIATPHSSVLRIVVRLRMEDSQLDNFVDRVKSIILRGLGEDGISQMIKSTL